MQISMPHRAARRERTAGRQIDERRRACPRSASAAALARRRGAESSRAVPACTASAADRTRRRHVPVSTSVPAYITATRSAKPAMTPRSWVIRMIAAPVTFRAVCSTSRICAWIVTSSAVVGSSAMIERRIVRDRHRDHHALPHAAGELVRKRGGALPRVRNADQREQLDRPARAACAADVARAPGSLRRSDRRRCRRASAPTADPGRPSRSASRGSRTAPRRTGRSARARRSAPSRSPARSRGSRSMIASDDTDLPDPDSPTMPSTSPGWTS